MKPARGGPVTESTLVQVHVPGPLARRLARLAPGTRLDGLCVAALGELARQLEEQEQARPGKLPIGRRP